MEIKDPELDSPPGRRGHRGPAEKRIAHRRAMRRAMERTMQSGALGIKVMVGGRVNGAEIARREWQREGPRAPAHLLRRHRLRHREAMTHAGLIGVKVWIFKKQLFVKAPRSCS